MVYHADSAIKPARSSYAHNLIPYTKNMTNSDLNDIAGLFFCQSCQEDESNRIGFIMIYSSLITQPSTIKIRKSIIIKKLLNKQNFLPFYTHFINLLAHPLHIKKSVNDG